MLAAVVGLVLSGVVCSLADVPQRCCLDNQYSVRMGLVGEVLGDDPNSAFFIDGNVMSGYDFYTDRMGSLTRFKMPDGSMGTRYELKDYAARRVYESVNNASCTYKTLEAWDVMRPLCIPDNATYLGPSTLGYGHNSLKLNTWSFSYQLDAHKTSQIIMSLTQDHCVPVTETIIGVYQGIPLEETLFFMEYHPGLEKLQYLEPPKNCQPAPTPTSRQ